MSCPNCGNPNTDDANDCYSEKCVLRRALKLDQGVQFQYNCLKCYDNGYQWNGLSCDCEAGKSVPQNLGFLD